MRTSLFAMTTVLLLAGTSTVFAQNRQGPDAPRWRPNVEDIRAFGDARLAALKAGLQLKTDQEKHWPAFEAAARDFQRHRLDALNNNRSLSGRTVDPVEQMQRRAAALAQRGGSLKNLAEALAPLYGSLDDGQKRRFAMLDPLQGPGDFGRRFRNGGHRQWNRSEGGFHRTGVEGLDRAGPREILLAPDPGEQPR